MRQVGIIFALLAIAVAGGLMVHSQQAANPPPTENRAENKKAAERNRAINDAFAGGEVPTTQGAVELQQLRRELADDIDRELKRRHLQPQP